MAHTSVASWSVVRGVATAVAEERSGIIETLQRTIRSRLAELNGEPPMPDYPRVAVRRVGAVATDDPNVP